MNENEDFWGGVPENDVPEPPKISNDLPDKANVILETCDGEAKETMRPQIKVFARKDGTGDYIVLKVATRVVGGDQNIKPFNVGKPLFKDFSVEKPTAEQLENTLSKLEPGTGGYNRVKSQLANIDKYPCGPELYNFILDTLAPEGKTTAERWATARAKLAEVATAEGLAPASVKGNIQVLYATAFKSVLFAGSVKFIGTTYTPKQRPGSEYAPQQTFGSIGALTDDEAKRRKVSLIAKQEDGF